MNVDVEPAFADTNILVYALAGDDPARSRVAQALLRTLMSTHALRTSTQVMQELFVNLTRKARKPIPARLALRYMDEIAAWPVVVTEFPDVREGILLAESKQLSFWDALIVVAAAKCEAKILYTEDLQHGQIIAGVKVVNPFRGAQVIPH